MKQKGPWICVLHISLYPLHCAPLHIYWHYMIAVCPFQLNYSILLTFKSAISPTSNQYQTYTSGNSRQIQYIKIHSNRTLRKLPIILCLLLTLKFISQKLATTPVIFKDTTLCISQSKSPSPNQIICRQCWNYWVETDTYDLLLISKLTSNWFAEGIRSLCFLVECQTWVSVPLPFVLNVTFLK